MKLIRPLIKQKNKPVVTRQDFNTNISVDEIQAEFEERKFKPWDNVVENDLLNSPDPAVRAQAFYLLWDPSVYFYAFFKDFDDLDKPFKVYYYQDAFLNDLSDRRLLICGNQQGKSITLILDCIHTAIFNPGTTQLVVSKSLPQAKDLMLQMKQMLRNGTIDYTEDLSDTDTKTELYIKQIDTDGKSLPDSRIICVPATGSALSYKADKVHLDEVSFQENGETNYQQIYLPRTFASKGQISGYSNPNGQQGLGWKLWNDPTYSKYNFNYLDKPGNTQEDFERASSGMDQDRIDSTLLAKFTSAAGAFLSIEERERIQHKRENMMPPILADMNAPQKLYIFFDWGKAMDRTVRTTARSFGTYEEPKVYVDELLEYPHRTGYDIILEDLFALIKHVGAHNIAMIGWDNTGVGKGVEDFINRVQQFGIMVQPVEFQIANKSRIYTIFKYLVEQTRLNPDRISLPFVPECDKQLAKLRFKKTTREYMQVHHESEQDRDDYPDSIVGCVSLIVQPDNPPVTATIVGAEESEEQPA